MPAREPTTPPEEPRKPINARGVAWALTGVTAFVLVVGVAVVRTASPPPMPVTEEIREEKTTPPPIVLQPRRVDPIEETPDAGSSAATESSPLGRPSDVAPDASPRFAERPLPIAESPQR